MEQARQFTKYLGFENDDIEKSINDHVKPVLSLWDKNYNGYQDERLAALVKACRQCGFVMLANEIEQGKSSCTAR